MNEAASDVDAYIAGFAEPVQALLQSVRQAVRRAAPAAQEGISYRIPAYRLNGRVLIYFAGFKQHIGLYPIVAGDGLSANEFAEHASGKASLRFALDRPLPLALIERVVKAKAAASSKAR
jgi:uncharacterized protein YdhG (YjbR/CyaY superfamily)